MNDPKNKLPPAFGDVDFESEHGLFYIDIGKGRICRLTLVGRTERGYPRRELASIPSALWKQVSNAVQNELIRGLDADEQGDSLKKFKSGDNGLSPLIVRELAVLLWALMEDAEGTHVDALVAGWRQLAREERWWLYARASSPAQQLGQGWRRALFFALTDPSDTRTAPRMLDLVEAASGSKKNSGAKQTGSPGTPKRKRATKKKAAPKATKKAPVSRKQVKKSANPEKKPKAKKKVANTTKSPSKKTITAQTNASPKKRPAPRKVAKRKKATTKTAAHK